MAQTEEGELKRYNNDNDFKITTGKNVDTENSTDNSEPFGLLLTPNQISGKLTECNDIQFGTCIITSNLNVNDQNKNICNDAKDVNDRDSVDSVNTAENSYCHIGCEKFEKLLTVLIFLVSLMSLLLVVSILIPSYDTKHNFMTKPDLTTDKITTKLPHTSLKEDTSTATIKTTEDPIPWLISYREWSGTEQPKTCYKNLPPTNKIKFWYDTAPCNTFKTCTYQLKQQAYIDIDGCHFDDVMFHFAVSEQGLVFECRSTSCEIPPEYKKCNESVLFVRLFIKYTKNFQNEDQCKNSLDFAKQFEGLKNLIEYNRRKGVLLENPLTIYIVNKYCGEEFYRELNKTFGVSDLYQATFIMCPGINTCIEN